MNIHDFIELKGFDLRQVMDFASCINPLGPSNKAKHAIRKGIKYLSFPPDEEIRRLKRYICKREQIGEDSIIFGQNLTHILHALACTFLPKTVFIPSPVSLEYKALFSRHDVEVMTLPIEEEDEFCININRLIGCIQDADMIMLPNPHDITGTAFSIESLTRVIEETKKQGKMLVIDETFIEFAQSVSPVRQVTESENALIFRTFSAFHALSGLPAAYIIGSPGLLNKINDITLFPYVGTLAYMAALASLKDKGYKLRTQRFIEEEKQFIMDKAKNVSRLKIFDTPCNFLLLKIQQPVMDLEELLMKRNILVDKYDNNDRSIYIRMPIKTHKFNARFIKTLKYILDSPG